MTATVRAYGCLVRCDSNRTVSRSNPARVWRRCRHQPRPDPGCPIPDSQSLPRITFSPGTRGSEPIPRLAYRQRSWRMLPGIDRVYVNRRARDELGWRPRFDFRHVLDCLRRGDEVFSPLARAVGSKGYHSQSFEEGPYPVERNG